MEGQIQVSVRGHVSPIGIRPVEAEKSMNRLSGQISELGYNANLLAIQLEVTILNRDETRCVVSPDQRQSCSEPELEYHDQIKQRHAGHDKENWGRCRTICMWRFSVIRSSPRKSDTLRALTQDDG